MPTTQFSQLWLSAMPLLFVILWSTGFIGAKFGLPHADALAFECALCFGDCTDDGLSLNDASPLVKAYAFGFI